MRKGRDRSKCFYILSKYREPKKKYFLSNWEIFVWNWKKNTFWHWEWGRISAPKSGNREPCAVLNSQFWCQWDSYFLKEAIFFRIVGLPLFGKEGSGTPIFNSAIAIVLTLLVFPLGPFRMALRHALFLERHALFLCVMPFSDRS